MRREVIERLQQQTRSSYDRASKEFSDSRNGFWEELSYLAEHAQMNDAVLDVGCGNGRLYPLIAGQHAHYTGIDYSEGLIALAKEHHPNAKFLVGNALNLPFADAAFDVVFSFAAIHHIPSRALRVQFLRETFRVMKKGGSYILSTWYLWDSKLRRELYLAGIQRTLFLNPYEYGDIVIGLGKKHEPRYIHAYRSRELLGDIKEAGFTVIDSEIASRPSGSKNLVVVAKKL